MCLSLASDLPSQTRSLDLLSDGEWIGMGVSYGPFRDGQSPWEGSPAKEQLREHRHARVVVERDAFARRDQEDAHRE